MVNGKFDIVYVSKPYQLHYLCVGTAFDNNRMLLQKVFTTTEKDREI